MIQEILITVWPTEVMVWRYHNNWIKLDIEPDIETENETLKCDMVLRQTWSVRTAFLFSKYFFLRSNKQIVNGTVKDLESLREIKTFPFLSIPIHNCMIAV